MRNSGTFSGKLAGAILALPFMAVAMLAKVCVKSVKKRIIRHKLANMPQEHYKELLSEMLK